MIKETNLNRAKAILQELECRFYDLSPNEVAVMLSGISKLLAY